MCHCIFGINPRVSKHHAFRLHRMTKTSEIINQEQEVHTKQIFLTARMAQSDPEFQLKCQIIQEVQQRPILYNKGHPKYQISSCRNEEFAHISVAVGKTGKYNLIHVLLIMISNFIWHLNHIRSMYNNNNTGYVVC